MIYFWGCLMNVNVLILLEGQAQLFLSIRDNGAIPGHRLMDGPARDEEKAEDGLVAETRHLVAIPVEDKAAVATETFTVNIRIIVSDNFMG